LGKRIEADKLTNWSLFIRFGRLAREGSHRISNRWHFRTRERERGRGFVKILCMDLLKIKT
jgi:hypothetical protein